VFTPFAELFHFESVSRGTDLKLSKREKAKLAREAAKQGREGAVQNDDNSRRYNKEAALFRNRWRKILDEGDPYYNPNFSLDRSDYSLKLHKKKEDSKE
jgi:hypothetical protein